MSHDLLPVRAKLVSIALLAPDNSQFTFLPERSLMVEPGQFVEVSLPGIGSFPVSSCDIVRDRLIVTCIRRAGRVTGALFQQQEGVEVGLRGPFGNGFPIKQFKNRDVLLIAGGLGMAPLRALLMALLEEEQDNRRIFLLYGARDEQQLLYGDELASLAAGGRIELRFAVDSAADPRGTVSGIPCHQGLVNELLRGLAFDPRFACAVICGPPALYGCVLEELAAMGIDPQSIYATLERRMRCGVGECCHCVTGGVYICRDGPVFSLQQLREMEDAI